VIYTHRCQCGKGIAYEIEHTGIGSISGFDTCPQCSLKQNFNQIYVASLGLGPIEDKTTPKPGPVDPLGLDTGDKKRPS